MATSLAHTIKSSFLNCAICLESFQDPRALPCQHGFCKECLEQCVASSKDKSSLVCPTCRKEVKISKDKVEELPVHFLVSSLKDTVDMELEEKALSGRKKMTCSNCNDSGNIAKVRCVDCKDYLCDTCHAYHKTFKAMKDHKVITMEDILAGKVNVKREEENRYCKVHGKLCEYFCQNEKRVLCRDCVILNDCPAQHTRVSLKKAAESHETELQDLVRLSNVTFKKCQEVAKTTATVRAELEIYSQIATNSLEKVEEEYINLVKKTVKDFKGMVDHTKKERQNLLDELQGTIESTMKDIKKASEDTTRILDSGSEFEVLATYATLSEQLQQLANEQPDEIDTSLCYMKFEAASPAIPTIGQLLKDGTQAVGEEWKQGGQFSTGDFNRLHGLDINKDGDIVVCSWEKGAKVFSRDGQVKCTLQSKSSCVMDVAVTPNHEYVAYSGGKLQIDIFDDAGRQVNNFGYTNKKNKSCAATSVAVGPSGKAAVGPSGKIIVGQVGNTISIHDVHGVLLTKFATKSMPYRLAATSNAEIASSFYDRELKQGTSVQLMDYSGGNVRVIQPPPEVEVWCPGFVCCREGEIFVCNEGKGEPKGVFRFTSEGDYLGCVTTDVRNPSGIAVSRDGMELFVADYHVNQVNIFKR